MVTIRNATDTWVNQEASAKNYGTGTRIRTRTAASQNRYGLIFFNQAWPKGATILSAHLKMRQVGAAATSTATIERAAAKWSVNRVTYSNMPGVTGSGVSLTKTTPADATEWDWDVTSLVQSVASGAPWYGFRIRTSATALEFHSTETITKAYRPVLEVTWSFAPDAPVSLSPGAGRAIQGSKPILRFGYNDLDDNALASVQVQIDPGNSFAAPAFDSGEVASSVPELDLNTTAYAGLAVDATTYWRARVKDSSGLWSPWSASTSFVRKALGTLSITAPGSGLTFTDGSPTVTWSLTGTTQKQYRLYINDPADNSKVYYDTGKLSGTANSVNVPFGKLPTATKTYRVVVQVWDTIDRESIPGEDQFITATRTPVAFAYNESATAVTSLAATSDPLYPHEILTWSRSVQPTHWQILRSDDGGTTWTFVAEALGADLLVSGSNYTYKDTTPDSYVQYLWRVVPVDSGVMGRSTPTITGMVTRLAPFLYREDGSDACCFLNPDTDQDFLDVQELFVTLGDADPMVVTQKLGRRAGHVAGLMADNVITGVSARTQLERFKRLRNDTGQRMRLALVDQTIKVVAYNMRYKPDPSVTGIAYLAEFDWVESTT